ncbi:MAG TPA: hypothetical protein PKA06_05655, partial [Gemmatales bacterium]|nr:hypothetical protein [Gemmatales bacterium]
KFGMTLRYVIGPKTGHSYHPDAKREIEQRLSKAIASAPWENRTSSVFTTWTLRYASCGPITLQQLEEHWKPARIQWEKPAATGPETTPWKTISTSNVAAFSVEAVVGEPYPETIIIDKETLQLPKPLSDGALTAHFRKEHGTWQVVDSLDHGKLRKKPGLQGPIDDAFMESFLIVKPSEKSPHGQVNAWVEAEMNRAIDHWRRQFRGIPRVKLDKEVTENDIKNHHLILWGLPASNAVLKKMVHKLPIYWADGKIQVNEKGYDADTHVPIFIYPNPLNPSRYVVLNSGFTFREYDYLNNARQVPKLPDWAIIDITTPPNSRWPGRVVDANFFSEQWQWK